MKYALFIIFLASAIILFPNASAACDGDPFTCSTGEDGCECSGELCGIGECSGSDCVNHVCWGFYSGGNCYGPQGLCDYVPATPPCTQEYYTGKQSCSTCQECPGNSANCANVAWGNDPHGDCSYELWCNGGCSYYYSDGSCNGGGNCDGDYYNVQSGNVCNSGLEYACSTSFYADSASVSCTQATSPDTGFGDRQVSYYACDGFGSINYGSACATSSIDCGTGCCYDAGASTSCVGTGSVAYNFYSFGTGDGSTADYCTSAKVRDCSTNSECASGTCLYNNCIPTTGRVFVQTNAGADLAVFDQYGRIVLKGTLYQSTGTTPPAGSWQIQNGAGTAMGWVTGAGHLYLKGTASTFQGSVTPAGNNDFIIQNSAGTPVAYIDGATGNLYTIGTIVQNSIP